MALNFKVGSFAANAAAGLQSVTGVGFQPSVYILFCAGQTSTSFGYAAEQDIGFGIVGFHISGADSRTVGYGCKDAVSPSSSAGSFVNPGAIGIVSLGSTRTATHDSFLSDGFQINWSGIGSATEIFYIALGGSDITNVEFLTTAGSGATGTQTISSIGFQGDAILMCFLDATVGFRGVSIGAAVSATKRWAMAFSSTSASSMGSTMKAKRYQRTDCILLSTNGTAAETARADFTGFTSNGFTLNWVTASTGVMFYLVLKTGGQVDVGALNKSISGAPVTDTVTPSLSGKSPVGVILATFGLAATTTISADARGSLGAGDGTNQGHVWSQTTDATIATVAKSRITDTKAIGISTAPSTTDAEADLALTATDFTLTWTTNDAVAAEILWMAFGSQGAAPAIFQDAWGQPTNIPSPLRQDARGLLPATFPMDTNPVPPPAALPFVQDDDVVAFRFQDTIIN